MLKQLSLIDVPETTRSKVLAKHKIVSDRGLDSFRIKNVSPDRFCLVSVPEKFALFQDAFWIARGNWFLGAQFLEEEASFLMKDFKAFLIWEADHESGIPSEECFARIEQIVDQRLRQWADRPFF